MKLFLDITEKRLYNIAMSEKIRINKYLSESGYCSRREADRLLSAGRITAGGRTLCPGDKVSPEERVFVDGKPVKKEEKKVLLLFYKPRGVVCSTKKQYEETTVTEYLKYPVRIYPVGRLDKDSEGLLLLTNQGSLVNHIMRARNFHEKEYLVTVDHPITEDFLMHMRTGVPVLDTVTRPCQVFAAGKCSFRIILTQGLNRQIRRMCEYLGYQVRTLKRIRIMNLTIQGLAPGSYREITKEEYNKLTLMIRDSSSGNNSDPGGNHGSSFKQNESISPETESGIQGLLSGRQGDHEQSGVRCPVRSAGRTGKGNRHSSGRQSNHFRRI